MGKCLNKKHIVSYKNGENLFTTAFALGIAVKIPAMRVCSAKCSTDCHAPIAMTDCNEKPDPQGNAHQNGGRSLLPLKNKI